MKKNKEIECDKCGRVSKIHFPIYMSCCPECGSLKIRLYKTRKLLEKIIGEYKVVGRVYSHQWKSKA